MQADNLAGTTRAGGSGQHEWRLLAMNRVQSQAGLSMTKFMAQYNAETQCV
jgi:hypothetical protein